ncbi:SDR family oxidoreductase [Micromonospora sp. NPDC000207]|uniref:SDR family oxidoreductase n=1 Tax=Micromonospora sp. NPDC000207 TaxID=3154246 RepID=UPI0033236056
MTATESLHGRVALVTGAAKSLGADIVRRLAGCGAHVIVNYFHSVDQAERLRAELTEAGHSCEFIRASVAKRSEIDRMFDLVRERHGGLDFLINNAAGGAFLPLFDVDDTYWQRAWSTNVMGAYHCSRRAAELMTGRPGAGILCLSSVGAHQPVPGYGPGGVTKAALESMVRYLALELADQDIRVNTVLLGSVASEIVVNLDDPAAALGDPAETSDLMRRTITTPEAARLIVHFLHPDAGFITGQTVVADGGISIGGMQGLRLHSKLAAHVGVPARPRPTPATMPVPTSAEPASPAPVSAEPVSAVPVSPASTSAAPVPPAAPVSAAPVPVPVPSAALATPAPTVTPVPTAAPAPTATPVSTAAPAPTVTPVPTATPDPTGTVDGPGYDAIAVVGLGVALPGANNPAELYDRLREGALLASEPSAFDLEHFWSASAEATDSFYVREAGYMQSFVPEPASVGEPDGNVGHPGWPRTTRWLRHCAVQALAGVGRRPTDRWLAATTGIHDQTGLGTQGVVLGDEYQRLIRDAVKASGDDDWLAELADHAISAHYGGDGGDPKAYLPAAVSRNALRGLVPDDAQHLTLDAACATGLFCLDAAVKALREGSCDVALVGGTSVIEPIGFTLFCRAQGITTSGRIRPFDQAADGTLIGEGAVMLALKPYSRAVADGDRVHGVILGTGLAADGRGKGIHAPATRGQELAIGRAWSDAGVDAADVDWVVAHGTGTPVGDEVELRSLLSRLGERDRPCLLTSNKQVFGHTGVLAGLVSVAHALVALANRTVPGHTVVTDPHPLLGDGTRLTVPVTDTPWPADEARPRVVGVSSFGLGGADAHVVLSDRVPVAPPVSRRPAPDPGAADEDLVVVGWNTHLPGLDRDRVPAWLAGDGPSPHLDFGTPYPLPSPLDVRIPPRTMRHMDPAHLMMLQALGPLLRDLGEPGTTLRPTTAVLVGATLPTTHNARAALRVHAGECAATFDLLPDAGHAETLREYLAKALADADDVIPRELNEDDFTGAVSCILSGRAANYYDFRGFGTSVYAHRDSTHCALDLALRQLRHRACDLALVGAVSLRPISGWARHLDGLVPPGRSVAEGAAVVAIARRSTARDYGLPVLGVLATTVDGTGDPHPAAPAHTLPALADAGRTYLALDALLAVLRAVVTSADVVVTPAAPGSPSIRVTGPVEETIGRRQTFRLRPITTPPPEGEAPAIPAGSIVVTDTPDLAVAVAGPDVAVWSPAPGLAAATHVPPEAAADALAGLPFVPRHVRILSRLTPPADDADDTEAARLEDLQDLAFTTLRAALPALRSGGTLAAVLLGALPDGLVHPLGGLFTGLVRSVRAEVPQCGGNTLLTDALDAPTALRQAARAGTVGTPTHTVACRGDAWSELAVADDDAQPYRAGESALPPDAVVVAFGGARGITPELLDALARTGDRPHLYVIGRTPLPETDDPLPPQAEFIADRRRRQPDASVRDLKAAYEQAQARLEVSRTVQRLTRLCGPDRVHHRVCDVLDADRTAAVLGEILDRHGQIDLLVNTVLDLRSRALHAKTLADFRAVRATKAAGYRNLRRALAGRPPRIWCNFSTLATLAPAPGDIDYCAVNEYLAYASAWADRHAPDGHRELAILWSGWREVGVASSAAMQETLRRNRMDAYISTAQGTAQFLSAVTRPTAGAVVFFIREEERVLLGQRGISTDGGEVRLSSPAPDAPPPAPPDPALTSPLLDGVLLRGDRWAVFTKTWEPHTLAEQDGRWMRHHRVNGEYVLPGTFALEAAAGAAGHLCPGLVVTGFRDLVCRTSVTVRSAGPPRTITVEARLTDSGPDHAEVAVRITTHRVGRNGKVLRFNDLLCETTVVLADSHPSLTAPTDRVPHQPEPDFTMPVYSADLPITLSGPFAGTGDYARGPDGTSATFRLDHQAWGPALAGMTVPAILLDAMVHLLLLPPRGDHPPLVGPMAGIEVVDLGGAGNDCQLSAAHPTIRLHCRFADGALTALTGDGRVLARMTGVSAHATDHSGRLVRPYADAPRPALP